MRLHDPIAPATLRYPLANEEGGKLSLFYLAVDPSQDVRAKMYPSGSIWRTQSPGSVENPLEPRIILD